MGKGELVLALVNDGIALLICPLDLINFGHYNFLFYL